METRKVVVNHEVKAGAAELFTVGQLAEISQNPDPDFYDLAGDRSSQRTPPRPVFYLQKRG